MNRKIIFRGKSFITKKWIFGNLIKDTLEDDDSSFTYIRANSCEYQVLPETIGEFTGFKDNIGNDIYEGDIVKTPLLDPIFGDILKDAFCNAVIKFNNGAFVVSYYNGTHNIYLQDLHNKIEIIGNIYDNSELLDKE